MRGTEGLRSHPVRRALALPAAALTLPAAALLLAACARDGRDLRPARPDQRQSILTTTTTVKGASVDTAGDGEGDASAAPTTVKAAPAATKLTMTLPWADNGAIDPSFTCKGAGTSPAVSWKNVPAGTKELALTVTDDDAAGFVHWVIAGLPATATGIPAGAPPAGAAQAFNGNGASGWYGPCPPAGAKHRYRFTLYALAAPSGLVAGADTRTALAAVQRNVVGLDVVFGTFTA